MLQRNVWVAHHRHQDNAGVKYYTLQDGIQKCFNQYLCINNGVVVVVMKGRNSAGPLGPVQYVSAPFSSLF